MPSETNKVKPDGNCGETRPPALGVGEPHAHCGPSAGAGKAPAPSITADELVQYGFELATEPSDGEVTCTDCWDESDHDVEADTCIAKGQTVYLLGGMTDCGPEWDAYCQMHAEQRVRDSQA